MKGLKIAGLGLIGAVAAIALLVASASAVSGTLSIGDVEAAPGAEVTVDVTSNVPDPGLGAWTVNISYDADVVTATDCGGTSTCNTGFAADAVRITGASANGEEGETVLSNITFSCDAEGTSALTADVEIFSDATIGDPQDIDETVTNGSVTCSEAAADTPVPTEGPEDATATPSGGPSGIGDVGTGPGSDSGSGLGWLIAVLALAGIAGIVGFGALRLRARRT